MKIRSCMAVVIYFGLSSLSWSYMITDIAAGSNNGAIVGELDNYVAYTSKASMSNSNPDSETNWVNSILNPDVNYTVKTEKLNYYQTNGTNIFAFELKSKPEYFVIKNSIYWALYQNVMSLDWGVFDADALNEGFNLPDGDSWQISHVSEFSGAVSVPEPGSISLLVLGLIGLVIARKKIS